MYARDLCSVLVGRLPGVSAAQDMGLLGVSLMVSKVEGVVKSLMLLWSW